MTQRTEPKKLPRATRRNMWRSMHPGRIRRALRRNLHPGRVVEGTLPGLPH